MYSYWDIERKKYFSNLGPFFDLLPPRNPENQNFEKMKKLLKTSSFYTSAPEIMITCYTVPKIWCVTDAIIIFQFGLFFALLPN